jgi:hypothetical protein
MSLTSCQPFCATGGRGRDRLCSAPTLAAVVSSVDLVYGIPSLTALLLALAYVRHVARRDRRRAKEHKRPPSRAVRSLSQRSEMRAGDDHMSVMEDLRTHSKPAQATDTTRGRRGKSSATNSRRR